MWGQGAGKVTGVLFCARKKKEKKVSRNTQIEQFPAEFSRREGVDLLFIEWMAAEEDRT